MTTVSSPFDLALRFNNNSVRAEDRIKSLRVSEVIKENKAEAGAGKTQVLKVVALFFKVKILPS